MAENYHVYIAAFVSFSMFQMNFHGSQAMWILCYFSAIVYHMQITQPRPSWR